MADVCLVVPCYNEERRLDVPAFERFLEASPEVSFCFVNDGSRDRTQSVLNALQTAHESSVLAVDMPQNVGKAEAVRQGMLRAHGWKPFAFIGYWDADLATPLEAVHAMC